jgi:3-oxoacyl-[acyl-carrier protein] reductase
VPLQRLYPAASSTRESFVSPLQLSSPARHYDAQYNPHVINQQHIIDLSALVSGDFLPNENSSRPLADKVALVTGAGRGIGKAISLRLAELGAHTVLCGRSPDALRDSALAIEQLSAGNPEQNPLVRRARGMTSAMPLGRSSVIECDVSDNAAVEALAKEVSNTFQRLDILVNNAGIAGPSGPLHELAPETWDEVMNTNLRGVYYCIRSLTPLLIKTGAAHIINISSLAGKNPVPNLAAYSASKWGLNGLSYSVAEELRPHGIRVSVICPGSVHTDFSLHAGKNAEKMLQASDVAHAVAMIVTQAPQSFASEISLRPTQKP